MGSDDLRIATISRLAQGATQTQADARTLLGRPGRTFRDALTAQIERERCPATRENLKRLHGSVRVYCERMGE